MPMLPSTVSPVIRTATGRLLDPMAPDPAAIDIRDIAHALANLCRFGGHTKHFFSVAQHSVMVSRRAAAIDPASGLWALLHDASEAYLVDVPRPLKHSQTFAGYRAAEQVLQTVIYRTFDCHGVPPSAVATADDDQLAVEFRDLMPERPGDRWAVEAWGAPTLQPMTPHAAEAAFLSRYLELSPRRPA